MSMTREYQNDLRDQRDEHLMRVETALRGLARRTDDLLNREASWTGELEKVHAHARNLRDWASEAERLAFLALQDERELDAVQASEDRQAAQSVMSPLARARARMLRH